MSARWSRQWRRWLYVLALILGGAGLARAAPPPDRTLLLVVIAHPDDEAYFPGLIPYVCRVLQRPVALLVMTSGEAGLDPPGDRARREEEQRRACRIYGMSNDPIFARFPDGAFGGTLEDNWRLWGGERAAVAYLVQQIRRLRPDVVVTHALDGEYGHPNHVGTALAVVQAVEGAADMRAFPLQDGVAPWVVKKLYVHRWPTRPLDFRQDVPIPGDRRTCLELGNLGGRQHVSQGYAAKDFAELDGPACTRFGLYLTRVGTDSGGADLFEHVADGDGGSVAH